MNWLRGLFSRQRIYGEMSEEIRAHLQERVEELKARGITKKDAEYAARREFGNVTLTEEDARSVWRWALVENLLVDVRYAVRMLRKSPGFSTVAILTIALGIGANAAIFGFVDSALLNALPFRQAERLVYVWTTDASGETHSPFPAQYVALRKDSQTFEQIAGSGWTDFFYGSDESGWQSLQGQLISANWLDTLGVQPYVGRGFLEEEQKAGRDGVVMLSYACWRGRFHADRRIVGQEIFLNRRAVTVVGVLPSSLGAYYQNIEIFAPLVLDRYEGAATLRVGGAARLRIVGRLKDGVTLAQARAESEGIAAGLRGTAAARDKSSQLVVEDFAEETRHPGPTAENRRHGLLLMMAAAGVVLLIACANVAALLLARGVKRQREVAVRGAIGCSRRRMIQQLLTESTLLFVCGGALGLVAAKWSEEAISKAVAGLISSTATVEINPRVFLAGLGAALLSALIFGMIPALQMTRVNLNESLKDGIAKVTSGAGVRRPRNLLVVSQIALGMALMVGFGLLLRSLLHVESSPLGFDPRNVLTATVSLPVPRYADLTSKARVMREAAEQMRTMPGVESAGVVDSLPMDGADGEGLKIQTPGAKTVEEETWSLSVGPEYFSTLRIPMLAGRDFGERDDQSGNPVAIVNQTFAKAHFPQGNPIGYHLAFSDAPTTWREIVGVVSDFRQRNPEEDLRPLVYLPIAQTAPGHWSLVVRMRASSDIANARQKIIGALRPIDPQLYWRMGSMRAQIHDSESLTLRRPVITLLASFGGLALVLIVVGVFGVTSYFVAERTREIGIRVALGAARREVLTLVLRESLGVALVGLAVGALGAFMMASFFPTEGIGWSGSGIFLYGVTRTDWLTYSLAAVLLTSVVIAATWRPARRAMRVDPMVALRYE